MWPTSCKIIRKKWPNHFPEWQKY